MALLKSVVIIRDIRTISFFAPPIYLHSIYFQRDMSKMAVVVGNVTKSAPSGEGFIESTYVAPVYDSSARDFGSDFLLILILPLLVVFIIAIILGIIFFCFREGRSVPRSYFVTELCLYFLIKGLFTWRGEYPSTRKILEGR